MLAHNSRPHGPLESLAVFSLVALHGLLEFIIARAAVLVDDRQFPFDDSQLAVDLCNAVTVPGQGRSVTNTKPAPLLLGSACSSSRCSNNRSCVTASLAIARSASGSP
jgi:hypothetical protein